MIKEYLRKCTPLKSNSFFLFGPRGTGKSSLLKSIFNSKKCFWIDLLNEDVFKEYLLRPELLKERLIGKNFNWVIIDEVQRIPSLLNYVHYIIEDNKTKKIKTKFALTGSSARKLKRGGANLLAGRAFINNIHPLTFSELENDFDLSTVLSWGSLPKVMQFKKKIEKREFLLAYVNTYLKEEIREEQIVRNFEPFLSFLEVAAQANGEIINQSKIGRDSGNSPKAVERYFEILFDTLNGFYLPAYHTSVRKKTIQSSKFYFFDLGVKRAIENTLDVPLRNATYSFGKAFEHFFILECIRLNDYLRKNYKFSYLKTKDGVEIDLVIVRPGKKTFFIEIKSRNKIDESEFGSQIKLINDLNEKFLYVVSLEKVSRELPTLKILPWQEALILFFS
jgi:predicted AAA+ superfamily ATPase